MTKTQAKKLAQQIFDKFDKRIIEAVNGTSIPASFIAGLVANEAGKDRQGNIVEAATRFEPGVYSHLKHVAQTPGAKYNGVTHADLIDATDASLRALSTSYEATQMMGYWCIILHCTLADLKNPDKHFFYTVKLLELNGFPSRPTEAKMDAEMRQWNTGRETGKTYHENYVSNAQEIRTAYREIEEGRVTRSVAERSAAAPAQAGNAQPPAGDAAAGALAASVPSSTEQPPATQNAEQITNITGDKSVPDNFVPEDKEISAPAKEGSTAKAAAVTIAGFAVPAFLAGFVRAIQDAIANGFIDAKDIGNVVISFISNNQKYAFAGLGLVIGGMMLKKLYKQITLWISMYIAARADMHNVTVKPQ